MRLVSWLVALHMKWPLPVFYALLSDIGPVLPNIASSI